MRKQIYNFFEDENLFGIIINIKKKSYLFDVCSHWFAIKKIENIIYNLDSKLK